MKIRSKIFEELILISSKILKSEMNWWKSINVISKCFRKKWMISISNVDVKIDDFQIEYWTIFWFDTEIIELIWKNDRFVKKIDKIFEEYSNEKNVSNIDDQKFDFELNDEVFDSIIAQIFDMMFSWWLKFDLITWSNHLRNILSIEWSESELSLREFCCLWIKIIA